MYQPLNYSFDIKHIFCENTQRNVDINVVVQKVYCNLL